MTQAPLNAAQKAHIHAISKAGPRGSLPNSAPAGTLNDPDNLMLLCYACHKEIDGPDAEEKFPPERLRSWKKEHESRVRQATEYAGLRTRIITYSERIGDHIPPIHAGETASVINQESDYALAGDPISIQRRDELTDDEAEFWAAAAKNLVKAFERQVRPVMEQPEIPHFSVFALAPMPLLILLGTLFTDKSKVDVRQLKREPSDWLWEPDAEGLEFQIKRPQNRGGPAVLLLCLSARIPHEPILRALSRTQSPVSPLCLSRTQLPEERIRQLPSIWELAPPQSRIGFDVIRSRQHLSQLRTVARELLGEIEQAHPANPIHIFPAMPASCAVEFGRIRMPKVSAPWLIYDGNHKHGGYKQVLHI